MNYYPGQGLAIGTAILGSAVGQVYPASMTFALCKIFGTILKSDGTPAGKESRALTNTATGTSIGLSWDGVEVRVTPLIADAVAGGIIGIESTAIKTNAAGYFEIYALQSMVFTVTCPSFGKTVQVDTTGLTEKDLSSYF